ncbi:MAG: asparagine synthetase A [Candidatus Woesearchaeota archaeon]
MKLKTELLFEDKHSDEKKILDKAKYIHKIAEKINSKDMDAILWVQSCAMKAVHDFMHSKKVLQLMPVMISTITDPLCHSVYDAKIDYCGQELSLTKSMILHKQMALMSPIRKAIYIISPNIRLEKEECRDSGRHLIEFSQVDFEFKDAKKEDIKDFMEDMIIHVITRVKDECKEELKALGRVGDKELVVPSKPFKRISTKDAEARFGKDYEKILSEEASEPFWLTDHEREFYDKECEFTKRVYRNYDLIYPEGFGEGLSGGEREHEYEVILERMKRAGTSKESYKEYLELAKYGLLPKTAGGGFGVERMVRFLCGKKDIADVSLFAKKPGEIVVF